MNRRNIAIIGTGGAGNKLLDVLLDINPVYNSVFCNTNVKEMENLKHYDAENNSLYFASAQGTGRNRDKAKAAIKKDRAKTLDFFVDKYSPTSGIKTFFLIGSTDGGSGSGSMPMLAKILKRVNSNCKVNVLAPTPDFNSNILSLKNTLGFWKDILELMKDGIVDSLQFIDNNKMRDEKEFNYAVMKEFDDSIGITAGEIDTEDSEKVNTAKGYKVTLNLNPDINDFEKAVEIAKLTSNFVIPEDITKVDVLMANFQKDIFKKEDIKKCFKVFSLDKEEYVEDKNMIVLGGVELPKDHKKLIEMEVEKLEKEISNRDIFDDDDLEVKTEIKREAPEIKAKGISKKDLMNMINDDDFWDM
ncbi:hypothetical protein AM596_15780 [Clostridium perfringens CP4]|uniref:hypothetical protein n=1 Tax=Clostridium perfringens TaxID=1502 RepID=UPI000707AD78|nr:hypothetical protein [Clostridium perfringens]KQC91232.1 hypothetical protein AM596_15780 [Clostridium perfringens CP4]